VKEVRPLDEDGNVKIKKKKENIMIRNYYTDSYKGGRAVVPSDTLLISGTARAALSTTTNTNLALANSTTLSLTVANPTIQVGMQLSGTSAAGNIPTSGQTGYPVVIERINQGVTLASTIDNFEVSTSNGITLNSAGTGYAASVAQATTSPVGTGMTITTTVGVAPASTSTNVCRSSSGSAAVFVMNLIPLYEIVSGGTGYVTGTILQTTTVTGVGISGKLQVDIVANAGAITSAVVSVTANSGAGGYTNIFADYVLNDTIEVTQTGASGGVLRIVINPNIEVGDVLTSISYPHLNGLIVNSITSPGGFDFPWQVVMNQSVSPNGESISTFSNPPDLTFTRTGAGAGAIETGTIVAQGTGYKAGDIVTVTGAGTNGNFVISNTKSLTLASPNTDIAVGALVSGPGVDSGITITSIVSSTVFEISTVQSILANTVLDYSADGLTFTLSSPITFSAATEITYAALNQSSWKEYNLYIGSSPGQVTTNDNNASTDGNLILKSPNPAIKVNMFVGGTGVPADCKITSVTTALGTMTLTVDKTLAIAANIALTYSFPNENSIRVGTINDNVLTFRNPVQGSILPVSVVQVFSTGTNHVSGLIALD
tara:strand:+ start:261 stop:2060 length:1800 start_codon:yes stop_codon:yes gene_type:complete